MLQLNNSPKIMGKALGIVYRTIATTRLIDARTAWFVVGSERAGAMGPTLVSFGERTTAQAFADNHGGCFIRYEEIDLGVLDSLMPPPAAQEKPAGMKPAESQ